MSYVFLVTYLRINNLVTISGDNNTSEGELFFTVTNIIIITLVAVLGIFGVGFGMKSLYKMYYTSSKTNKKDLKSQFNIKSKFISTMGTNSQRALSGIKGSLRSLSMNRLSNRSKMSQIPKLLEAKSRN